MKGVEETLTTLTMIGATLVMPYIATMIAAIAAMA
jgi:hypothetical protein